MSKIEISGHECDLCMFLGERARRFTYLTLQGWFRVRRLLWRWTWPSTNGAPRAGNEKAPSLRAGAVARAKPACCFSLKNLLSAASCRRQPLAHAFGRCTFACSLVLHKVPKLLGAIPFPIDNFCHRKPGCNLPVEKQPGDSPKSGARSSPAKGALQLKLRSCE